MILRKIALSLIIWMVTWIEFFVFVTVGFLGVLAFWFASSIWRWGLVLVLYGIRWLLG